MNVGEVGLNQADLGRAAPEQPTFESCLVKLGRCLPVQPGRAGQPEVLGDDALGDGQAASDCLVREPAAVLESKNAFAFSARQALMRRCSVRSCALLA